MTEVWAVKHVSMPVERALRLLRQEHASAAEDLVGVWWTQKGRAHANRVDQYEMPVVDGRPGLLTELVSGPSAATWSKIRRRPLDELLYAFARILEAVAFGHRHGIVHGGLDAQRIRMRQDGADFFPKIDYAPGSLALRYPVARHLPPESAKLAEVTKAGDVWQLGVLLHEMIARQPATWPLAPLEPGRDDLPKGFDALIAALTAERPSDRPPSVERVWSALQRVVNGASDSESGDTPDEHEARWSGRMLARLHGLASWLRTE